MAGLNGRAAATCNEPRFLGNVPSPAAYNFHRDIRATMTLLSTKLIRNGKQQLRTLCPQPLLNWREAQYYGKYGEVELHFLEFLCSPDRDSIDVGAAEGSYVHFMRRFSNRVYAFEPIPAVARQLSSKFGSDVVIKNMALNLLES